MEWYIKVDDIVLKNKDKHNCANLKNTFNKKLSFYLSMIDTNFNICYDENELKI